MMKTNSISNWNAALIGAAVAILPFVWFMEYLHGKDLRDARDQSVWVGTRRAEQRFQDEAVAKGAAEYYLDGCHNKRWRWLVDPPLRCERVGDTEWTYTNYPTTSEANR